MAARPQPAAKRPGRRLLTFLDLKERGIPWTRVHISRLEAAGKFPRRINVSENTVAWFEDEVDDFLEAKAAARAKLRPAASP